MKIHTANCSLTQFKGPANSPPRQNSSIIARVDFTVLFNGKKEHLLLFKESAIHNGVENGRGPPIGIIWSRALFNCFPRRPVFGTAWERFSTRVQLKCMPKTTTIITFSEQWIG